MNRLARSSLVLAIGPLALGGCGDSTEPPAPRPAAIAVTPSTAEMPALGQTVQLTAEVRDQDGRLMTGAVLAWSTSAPSVAIVSASGLVTAASNGVATITATSGSVSGSAAVTVAQAVSAIAISPAADTLVSLGDTVRLMAQASDANGHAVAGSVFTWESGNTAVATLDASGLATAMGNGTATITAAADAVSGTATVTVAQAAASVVVTPTKGSLELADTVRLSAEAFDATGHRIAAAVFIWRSSAPTVARVEQTGLVTGTGEGTTAITVSMRGASAVAEITVVNPDRVALVALYHSTNGPYWHRSDNWLTDAPLGDWWGVTTDEGGRVSQIELGNYPGFGSSSGNFLSGPIPGELGTLDHLEVLYLHGFDLSGPIPAELENLTALRTLKLLSNGHHLGITGMVPPWLGNLTELTHLHLQGSLHGEIPPELANLKNLKELSISSLGTRSSGGSGSPPGKRLTGPIPFWLGSLTNLETLGLTGHFTGSIPVELGKIRKLKKLWLNGARLYGAVPTELQDLEGLQVLALDSVCRLQNRIRPSVCENHDDLCAPSDAMLAWLRDQHRIDYIARCGSGAAHLTQATQSSELAVPLVEGRAAVLQVFDVAAPARARFFVDGALVYGMEVPQFDAPPTPVEASRRQQAAGQAMVPGSVVKPGLEIVVEGEGWRIPQTGRQPIDVREVPTFELTVIPFQHPDWPDSLIVGQAQAMATAPETNPLLAYATTLLPVSDWSVTAHKAVWSDVASLRKRVPLVSAIRAMEGGTGYWMGLSSHGGDALGVATIGGWASVSVRDAATIAHELGHNLGLRHTPGVGRGVDPEYPYPGNMIGAWGFAVQGVCAFYGLYEPVRVWCRAAAGEQVSPFTPDVMSYARHVWISDYHFRKALTHRVEVEASAGALFATPTRTLLLWGGTDEHGAPFLDPAFVVNSVPVLPDSAGSYTLTGRDGDGRELFSVAFTMPVVADANKEAGAFVYTLPVQSGWEALASVTLRTPDGRTAALDGATDRPMTILRDARTGRVRGILNGPNSVAQPEVGDAAWAPVAGATAITSRGIPTAETWHR